MVGPLSGLTVIEVGELVSVPYATKLMADLGADVIKIEPPGGETARRHGPFPSDVPDPEKSGLYIYLNANKRGITLDLTQPAGQAVLHRLVARADVVVHHFDPANARRHGLDYETLARLNPRLVVTAITWFGQSGPYAHYKGSDLIAFAGSGIAHRFLGEPGREPLRAACYLASHWAATCGATATMLAVTEQELRGRGQLVDVAAIECLATLVTGYALVTLYRATGETGVRSGVAMRMSAPAAILPCRDGHVHLMALEPEQWNALVRAMGNPEWAQDPFWQVPSWERVAYKDELHALLGTWLSETDKQTVFARCQAEGAPCTAVNNVADLRRDPHLKERDFFQVWDQPGVGPLTTPGLPYRMSAVPWQPPRPAPWLGEHTAAVLAEVAGYSPAECAELQRAGVI